MEPVKRDGVLLGLLAVQLPSISPTRGCMRASSSARRWIPSLSGRMGGFGLRRNSREGRLLEDPVPGPAVAAALRDESGVVDDVNPRGEAVLAAYQPLDLPGLDWALVAEVGRDEVMAAANASRDKALYTAGIVAVLVLIFGLALSFWLLAPIRRWARVAGSGDGGRDVAEGCVDPGAGCGGSHGRDGGTDEPPDAGGQGRADATAGDVSQRRLGGGGAVLVHQRGGGGASGRRPIWWAMPRSAPRMRRSCWRNWSRWRAGSRERHADQRCGQPDQPSGVERGGGGEPCGRGRARFAVVASEIRKLAARTTASTEQIAGEVRTVLDTVKRNAEAIRSISSSIGQVNDQARTISTAAETAGGGDAGHRGAHGPDRASRVRRRPWSLTEVQGASDGAARAASDVLDGMVSVEAAAAQMDAALGRFVHRVQHV